MSFDDSDHDDFNLFQDPKDFYKPEPDPTSASHTQLDGNVITVRLVGHNPLWGHLLWNAGRTISLYIEEHAKDLISNRSVLEFGAASGLPSLVCILHGASHVVVTDYPDPDLIENIQNNIHQSVPDSLRSRISAEGYLWGNDTENILSHLPITTTEPGFDVLILADLLFNHSEHAKLLKSVQQTLKRTASATALVFFTPYRPWLLEKDLAFFDLAREGGFSVEKILEKVMDKVMFDEDPGDELLRRTVYGYSLTWKHL
ncbi:hypothetical protein EJ05DRAFT_439854 [Pseudovirgaria hyperparasitica]|uniref:Protein N-terminal and lysine N-methyltransferase EFM7 n=1 Tax=Pseudovirgaria hyperparasitica TaxID=470096 RepID=A0A6A6W4G6_9PEZI|nr:uncharacterized protein EJ05DRAFT_439854 [Pseudovirgaria hyperparasitica]KAF2757762.1 hypothetical protein EJ05DRAFT_439854 [Pseudovirgaria hyperparasitica]